MTERHVRPLDVVVHAAAFGLAGFAILQLADVRAAGNILAWFIAAVILHDAVVLPLYSALDRAGGVGAFLIDRGGAVPAANHVRVPAALSLLLAVVFFPLICGRSDANLERVSGVEPEGYLARWLVVSLVLFAGSAAIYLARVVRARAGGSNS